MSLAKKLTDERRSRLAAERMLELKQAELSSANRRLGQHAKELSEEIVETRAVVETIRGENKRVKSDLSAAQQRIAITERRLWHSIETINDGFAFFNAANEMIMANRAYLAVFDGLEVVDTGVNYITILQMLTDEGIVQIGDMSPDTWRQMMMNRFEMPAPEPMVIQLWNGTYIKMIDQRGPEGDVVSLCLDITASVAYEDQLKEARSIAESANRAKSAFLANMSHEIRTPMNGVIGMADVLSGTNLTDEQRLYSDTIKNSAEALLVIINDVLDYSKIEASKLDLHPEPFDLERAIEEVLLLLQPLAREKDISLLLDYDMFLPTRLIGDPGRIRQVMTNLIGNAVKFTTKGHVLIRVTGVPDQAKGTVALHIAVEDTGIGIPADMVNHIFGEFNQVENQRNRQFDGTGLGLAITQRLVEMMEGEVWVTSQEGRGSCFGFRITLSPAEASDTTPPLLPEHLTHVAIVDHDRAHSDLVCRQLRQLGLRITQCDDLPELTTALEGGIDLILADAESPAAPLTDILRTARQTDTAVPCLVFSAQPKETKQSLPNNSDLMVLRKPFQRHDLIGHLQRIEPAKPDAIAPAATGTQRLMRILAAEDNKTNQLVFRKMIKDLQIELTFAKDGEEAVAKYLSTEPDLVFMDISMPRMDGKDATRAIRNHEQDSDRHVPIVALTAHAMSGDDADILAAGLDHYLTKPLRRPDILARIKAAHDNTMLPLFASAEADQVAG